MLKDLTFDLKKRALDRTSSEDLSKLARDAAMRLSDELLRGIAGGQGNDYDEVLS